MPARLVDDKFRAGKLHSGGPRGPVVTDPKQMKAIQLSEMRKERAHGGKYPEKRRKKSKYHAYRSR